MKIICSINGIDGSGKTTQIQMFQNLYSNLIDSFGGLESYDGFPTLKTIDLHKWWFEDSSIEEFCDSIYKSLANRNKAVLNSKKNIILLDKGIINFEARIVATLLTRGYKEKEIQQNISRSKKKYNFNDIENLKIFLQSSKTDSKVKDTSFKKEQIEKYKIYNQKQIELLCNNYNKYNYIIHSEIGINDTFDEIKKAILHEAFKQLKEENVDIDFRKSLVYMGNTINYIDYKLFNTGDEFETFLNIIRKIEERKKLNIQIYNCKECRFIDTSSEEYKKLMLNKSKKISKVTNNIKINNIEKYEIPTYYKSILTSFIKDIMENIGNIRMLLVHGSAGRECMHINWSDLDIIIALERYNFREVDIIAKIIEKYKKDVKIGTTIYSKLEIESLNVDAKSLFALYQMQNQIILPLVLEDIDIPVITYEDLINKNLTVLPEAIHKLKRLLYSGQVIDRSSIIKTLNLIMKVILINNNIFFKSYEEVFYNFAKLYDIEPFEVGEYLNNKENDDEKLKEYAKMIVEEIINY
mgnify:CR=1 FL=1